MIKQNKFVISVLIAIVLTVALATIYIRYQRSTAVLEDTQRLFAGEEGMVTYTDVNGNEVSLEQYLGKILVVTTWASWSPFTASDLAILDEVVTHYEAGKVVALGINRMETKEQVERYMATMPKFSNVILVIDTADHFYKTVGGYAMPETLVFNQKGEVVEHVRGTINKAELENLIDSLLGEPNKQ
jgi:thiol-disulfide isomerase/thioredoxin